MKSLSDADKMSLWRHFAKLITRWHVVADDALNPSRPWDNERVADEWRIMWETLGNPEGFDSLADIRAEISLYFQRQFLSVDVEPVVGELTVTLTRNYGSYSITYGLTEMRVYMDEDERMAQYQLMTDTLINTHDRAEVSGLPVTGAGRGNPNERTITMTAIKKSNHEGEVRYRVMGAPYSKHGVPLYPEVVERDIPIMQELAYGTHEMPGEALIELNENRPVRVLRVTKE